jgi:hypothetical protein
MLAFDAPSLPSPLAMRECTRPRFDGNMESLRDWLNGLKSAGVRQAAPALLLALENLRGADLTANRRLSVLSSLKVPILKTCAGLPKPFSPEDDESTSPSSLTLEQRINRLMFLNLNQGLRQLDQQSPVLSARQARKRDWAIRNLFRFAQRQIRYSALWKTPLPQGTWRDLHELHLHLTTHHAKSPWAADHRETNKTTFDHTLEYKQLLLLGLAARLRNSVLNSEYFQEELLGWAVQTQLEDPHRMLGRLRLFLVEISEDEPPRQLEGSLDNPFRGWVLQVPYPFIHEIESAGYQIGSFGFQPLELSFPA